MTSYHSIIETIVNRNFEYTFQHQNVPNQRQRTHKNTNQQYQPIYYQIPRTSSITYLKEECIGCGLNNKGMIKLLIQNDGRIETCPLRGPLFINKNSAIEQLLQNNNKNGSQPKDFNKNIDTCNTAPPQATITQN